MPNADEKPVKKLEELLSEVIAEFDAKSTAFGEFEVFDKLRFTLGNRTLEATEQELYLGESNAFFFRGRMQEDDPLPSYFQPTMGFPRADGTTAWSPDPAQLTPNMITRWKQHLSVCRHPILRARYADLLWNFQKQVEGVAAPFETAHIAIDAYLNASKLSQAKQMNVVVWLGRAVGLAASIGDSARLKAVVQQSLDWAQANAKPNLPGTWVFLFEDIYDNTRVEEAEKARIIAYLETVLAATVDQTQGTFGHLSAGVVSELLATHFRRKGKKTEEERVIRAAGLATEHAASLASPLLALGWLQPLMERYRDAGMTTDAERVQIESRRRGVASGEDMKTTAHTIQVPPEAIEQYLGWICQPEESAVRLRRWAISNVNKVDDAKQAFARQPDSDSPACSNRRHGNQCGTIRCESWLG